MKKKVLILLVISLALVLTTVSAFADIMYVFCRPSEYVNVRMRPDSIVTGWAECGSTVETDGVTKKYDGKTWYHVINLAMEDPSGWICGQFLSYSPIVVEELTAYSCAKERVAIRKSPYGKVKKWLYNGEKTTVIARNDEWAITPQGYIKLEYLEFVTIAEEDENG